MFALATGVCVNPAPTAAQTGVPPSAPASSVSGRPALPGPDLIDLLRPCASGLSGDSAPLVHLPRGVGVWGARCERRPLDAQYVSGSVTESARQYYVRTEAGPQLRLVSAFPHVSDFDMSHDWMWGFMDAGDGPIVLQSYFVDAGGMFHGFLLDKGAFTLIDVPGAAYTVALGINHGGQIAGYFADAGGTHGFLLDKGTFTTIDVPGGAGGTLAEDINHTGQIVGLFLDAGFTHHGFLVDKGTFTPIDVPGATLTEARGINRGGQIVGFFSDGVTYHGFLAQ